MFASDDVGCGSVIAVFFKGVSNAVPLAGTGIGTGRVDMPIGARSGAVGRQALFAMSTADG